MFGGTRRGGRPGIAMSAIFDLRIYQVVLQLIAVLFQCDLNELRAGSNSQLVK